VVVDRPRSWDDFEAILHLGHEVLHQCGGEHGDRLHPTVPRRS
jgi:hypothetical protein